jgi:dihydropteroate synthase
MTILIDGLLFTFAPKIKKPCLMFTLNCNGRLVKTDTPLVMGIINATPDSFFAASRQQQTTAIVQQAAKMIADGATILDIGGQSTRPGSEPITTDEELKRVIPGIEAIHQQFPDIIISVDTYYAKVAKEAVAAGASMVNDISAGNMDETMIDTVASLHVPYVLMHMQGTPQVMQQSPSYTNVTNEVLDFFIQKIALLRKAGIHDLIVDPGFGFGKTVAHNFELLRNFSAFKLLQCPLLAGISRKSTIYKTLGTTADEALNGTTVLNTVALLNGASILRVHDVKEAKEAIQLIHALGK